jgi:hypothetical protein
LEPQFRTVLNLFAWLGGVKWRFYPNDNELHVSTKDGRLILEGHWGEAPKQRAAIAGLPQLSPTPLTATSACSISSYLRDLPSVPCRTPRLYSDPTDTAPIAVRLDP